MSIKLSDSKLNYLGNHFTAQNGWNRKLCFEARDTLFACADSQENGNKYRCPDELYAYEMWCPNDFRRLTSTKRRSDEMETLIYDKTYVENINERNNTISGGRWVNYSN